MLDLVRASDLPADPATLADEIARTAAHLDAATHRLLACIRAFDQSGEWQRQGTISCAHWLSWRIGLDPGAAREKVRVARALGALPHIDLALQQGALSYAKVRALTRVATPQNEAQLLELARTCTGAQLERICRRVRKVVNVTDLDDRRYLRHEVLDNGMVRLSAVLHPDEAALVMNAVHEARRRAASEGDGPGVSAETRLRTPAPDALVAVAEAFLAREDGSALSAPATQLVVHLDQDPLAERGTLAAALDDGTRVSAETFRRLGCDCTVVPLGARGTVGRRTRTVSPNLKMALWLRDRGCRFPGCSNHLFLHAHHIHHWTHGGPTTAENLVLLCSTHHRLLHEGGFGVTRRGDDLVFLDRQGRPVETAPRPWALDGDAMQVIESWNDDAAIDAQTAFPRWDGQSLDYPAVLESVIG
jgi:Domain of unknown function (DUF222)/HNH endonuclease